MYSDLLLIIQYLYGMNLQDSELPVSDGSFNFSELGMMRTKFPVLNLGAQVKSYFLIFHYGLVRLSETL